MWLWSLCRLHGDASSGRSPISVMQRKCRIYVACLSAPRALKWKFVTLRIIIFVGLTLFARECWIEIVPRFNAPYPLPRLAMSGYVWRWERERARPPDTTTNQDRHSTQTHRGTNCMYRRVRLAKCLVCVIVAAARVDQKPARQHRAKYTHACNGTYTHRRQHTTHEAHGRRRLFHYIRAHRQRQQIFHSVQYIWSVHTGCLAIPTIVLLLVRHISIYSRFSAFRPIFFLHFFSFIFALFFTALNVCCASAHFFYVAKYCVMCSSWSEASVSNQREILYFIGKKSACLLCVSLLLPFAVSIYLDVIFFFFQFFSCISGRCAFLTKQCIYLFCFHSNSLNEFIECWSISKLIEKKIFRILVLCWSDFSLDAFFFSRIPDHILRRSKVCVHVHQSKHISRIRSVINDY